MNSLKPGDIVTRKSYGHDILFKIIRFFYEEGTEMALLRGLEVRLYANAPLADLFKADQSLTEKYLDMFKKQNNECIKNIFRRRQMDRNRQLERSGHRDLQGFDIPGKVLHLDGDKEYMQMCLDAYRQLNIPAVGVCIDEEKQPEAVAELLQEHMPDLLVLTGHDGLIKGRKNFSEVDNYHNSKYFINAVRIARRFEKSRDDLVIFAGACQSHYEGIIKAGANFASSPLRVLIHTYDPVYVVEKIAYSSIYENISLPEIIKNTITGFDGIGGVETRGKYRIGVPKSPY